MDEPGKGSWTPGLTEPLHLPRRDYRPTWKLNQTETVAGNYYPVNSRIYIRVSPPILLPTSQHPSTEWGVTPQAERLPAVLGGLPIPCGACLGALRRCPDRAGSQARKQRGLPARGPQQTELGQAAPVCALKSWETDSETKPGVQAAVAGGRDTATPALCVSVGLPGCESLSPPCGGKGHLALGLGPWSVGTWGPE